MLKFVLLGLVVITMAKPHTSDPACEICHEVFNLIQKLPKQPALKLLEIISTQYCIKKHLQIQHVCRGAVKEMTRYILESAWQHFTDPHMICHQMKLCPQQYKILTLEDYTARVMKDYKSRPQEESTGKKVFNVMHISDIHPDFFYSAGSPADCNEPVCCRANVTGNANSTRKAGKWGTLSNCDLPIQTFNLFLDQVRGMGVDLILWTGDNTPHDVWQQSQDYNLIYSVYLTDQFKSKLSVPIIPSSGNHQSAPVNVYDFKGTRESFLNDGLATAWEPWIGKNASDMYRKNGFYSVYLEKFNLKIISLNTQAGNDDNWFLLRDPTDPGGQLEWMEAELRQAEKSGKFVYIIGHIPPRSNMNDWGSRYNVLVNRFAYTIRGQYFGHSHTEHLSFFTPINGSTEIINSCFISSSLTTYSDKNPEFRIMKIDANTLRMMDYDQYILKLETQLPQFPKFQLFYSFLKEYSLPNFSFQTQYAFRQRLKDDPQTQKKYTFLQDSGLHPGRADKNLYCDTMATGVLETTCRGGSVTPSLFDKVSGPWKELIHQ